MITSLACGSELKGHHHLLAPFGLVCFATVVPSPFVRHLPTARVQVEHARFSNACCGNRNKYWSHTYFLQPIRGPNVGGQLTNCAQLMGDLNTYAGIDFKQSGLPAMRKLPSSANIAANCSYSKSFPHKKKRA
ncbi:MAG TPA: hypothetical protein VE988_15425 [Gemmataceae bacterium]|nr:hypothetical protein [Gemmataceae bacterium]